jgi:hypothetical protein
MGAVSFREPAGGAALAGGAPLRMVAEGITIEETGKVRDGAGHFHVIADGGCVNPGTTIPRDADHLHFDGGQTEGNIYLEPGTHELCLQAGDGAHAALDATDTITITVDITSLEEWCAVVDQVGDQFETVDTADEPFAMLSSRLQTLPLPKPPSRRSNKAHLSLRVSPRSARHATSTSATDPFRVSGAGAHFVYRGWMVNPVVVSGIARRRDVQKLSPYVGSEHSLCRLLTVISHPTPFVPCWCGCDGGE